MDERALNELLECSVCLEQLDATSKVLQCQHTFCRRCLEEIVATKNELRCPECRMLVELRVDELPTNILLIRLLEGLKNCKAGITGQSSSANSSPSHTQPSSPGSAAGGSRTSPIHKVVNTSQPCSKALYNYDAKEPGDLTFKKGDVILLRRQVDDNWYHGELNSQHGFFPATYVQVITPLPQEVPKCKALYDFVISDKNEKDCLTFQKDEILTVIRRVDDNWAEGKLGERIGIFPISFVEMNDSAKWLINNQTQINARPNAVATPSQGTSNNGSPIHTANHTPSHTANHTPNHTANLTPSHTPNHTPSHTANHTPSHTANHTPSHTANHTPSHTANHTPSHTANHTPTHSSNHTPIHSTNHTPSHSAAPSSAAPSGSSSNNNGQGPETSPPGGSGSGSGGQSNPGGIPLAVLSNPTVAAVQRGAGQKRHSLTCISSHKVASQVAPQQRHSMELSGSLSLVPLLSSAPASVTSSPSKSSGSSSHDATGHNGPTASHMGPNGLVLYVALYNYKPQKDDEVELRKGDYYTVSEKCQDGWFKGTCLRTGNFGVFPGNYVQLVKISSKQTSSSVTRGAAPGAVAVGPTSNSSPSSSAASSASGAGCSGSSPARQSPQVAKVQQHVTVSRAHSFPKTSPLASMDYQLRAGHESGGARTAQGTPTHTSRSSTATVPPRPDPSVILTQVGGTPTRQVGRTVTNPAGAAAGLSSTSGTPCGSAHTSPAHMQSRSGYVVLSNGASGSASTTAEPRKSSHHHSSSHGHSRGSPRSARKSERSKHSSASAERMGSSKHGACPSSSAGATPGGHRSHSSEVPPHAPARTPHSGGTSALHSMAANATLTPPNVVVGAVGGNPPPPPPAPREKEKEKKKDKDRLGLMKRLTKSKKSKSPPPDPTDGASSSDGGPAHQRTGSCPANSVDGATAGVTPSHRKTSSLDTTSGHKVPRTKPLLRERCRCIVPYPPQSDIELELKLGDIVFVHKRRDDGWYKGTLQRTGKTGLFPGSFVETF